MFTRGYNLFSIKFDCSAKQYVYCRPTDRNKRSSDLFLEYQHTDLSHIRSELNEFNNRVFECRKKIDFNLKHLPLSSAFSVNKIIVSIDIQYDNVTWSYARQEVLSEPG